MTLQIPPRFLPFVKSVIALGEYSDEQAVLTASLELMQKKHQKEELAKKIQDGVDSLNRGEGLPGEVVVAKLKEKAAALGLEL